MTKPKKHSIVIRMGAASQSLTTGAVHIDLASATKPERYGVRRALIEGLKDNGYFGKKEQKKARYRQQRERQTQTQQVAA